MSFGPRRPNWPCSSYHADLLAQGYVEGHAGWIGGRGRFSYCVHEEVPGSIVELSEFIGEKAAYFESIAEAARTWGGGDPIRRRG